MTGFTIYAASVARSCSMKNRMTVLVVPLVLSLFGCAENPVSPNPLLSLEEPAASAKGTGLTLNSLTGLSVPLIGSLGDVVIDQAVITNFALVEDAVGAIIGIEATGVLQLTGGVLGTDVITEDFTTLVSVTSSGPGQCDLITIDLGPIGIDALGLVSVDVPAASLTGKGSGAVGSLLCNLGSILGGLTGGGAIGGILNGLNNQI
jgi:hypothetical protein